MFSALWEVRTNSAIKFLVNNLNLSVDNNIMVYTQIATIQLIQLGLSMCAFFSNLVVSS